MNPIERSQSKVTTVIQGSQSCRMIWCQYLLAVSVVFFTASCSALSKNDKSSTEMTPNGVVANILSSSKNKPHTIDQVVAMSLISALVQIDGYSPMNKSLNITDSNSGFSEVLSQVITKAGYKLNFSDVSNTPFFLDYSVHRGTEVSAGLSQTYSLNVVNIQLKRDYFVNSKSIIPNSNIYIKGEDSSKVILSDSVFKAEPEKNKKTPKETTPLSDRKVAAASALSKKLNAEKKKTLSTENTVAEKLARARDIENAKNSAEKKRPVKPRADMNAKSNMYVLKSSNFSDIFKEYADIKQHTVVFPNDSLRLGAKEKKTMISILDSFNPETDIISVVGCSHGKTAISDGNRVLATGRANKVKETLAYVGIDRKKILDEGCWAPIHFDEVFPRRGVVMTIKREKASG